MECPLVVQACQEMRTIPDLLNTILKTLQLAVFFELLKISLFQVRPSPLLSQDCHIVEKPQD